jgi:hypothetical protein
MNLQIVFVCLCLASAQAIGVLAQSQQRPADHPAIAYAASAPADRVARLQSAVESGAIALEFDEHRGYLPSLLRALEIPVSSQGLVFSRTSLQVDRIAPWTPRAVYFNDDSYVGWVPDGPIVEIATVDPSLGAVFYTLQQQKAGRPVFERQGRTCLQCHDSSSTTGGVPGLIMRSAFADRHGYVVPSDQGVTTDRTPLADRWGGWYVTGALGGQPHMGNVIAPQLGHDIVNPQASMAKLRAASRDPLTDLSARFDLAPYLTPHSDAVALMVLAHQASVHNLITAAGYEARRGGYDDRMLAASRGGAADAQTEGTRVRIETAGERLVRAMLFVKEAELTQPVAGTSGFAAEFSKRGQRDRQGRSLRDIDLTRRLFRYPLSYLIYSESFDAMPQAVKSYVYRRLREVLSGEDTRPEFSHLSKADRDAIREILEDTKADFMTAACCPAPRAAF